VSSQTNNQIYHWCCGRVSYMRLFAWGVVVERMLLGVVGWDLAVERANKRINPPAKICRRELH
jgi:hypothetical protein